MYHFTLQKKDQINLLSSKGASVHRLYNLMLNFVDKLQLPKFADPVTVFSPYPFLNCTYNECVLSQRNVVNSGAAVTHRLEGLLFQSSMI